MCSMWVFVPLVVFPVWGKKPPKKTHPEILPEWWEAGNQPPPQKKSTNIQQTEINVVKNSQDLSKSLNFQLLLTLFLKKKYVLAPHV